MVSNSDEANNKDQMRPSQFQTLLLAAAPEESRTSAALSATEATQGWCGAPRSWGGTVRPAAVVLLSPALPPCLEEVSSRSGGGIWPCYLSEDDQTGTCLDISCCR